MTPIVYAAPSGHLISIKTIKFYEVLTSAGDPVRLGTAFTLGLYRPSSFDPNIYVEPRALSETSGELLDQQHQLVASLKNAKINIDYPLDGPPSFLDSNALVNGRYNVCFKFIDHRDEHIGRSCHNFRPAAVENGVVVLNVNQSPIALLTYSLKPANPVPVTKNELSNVTAKYLLFQFLGLSLGTKSLPSEPFRLSVKKEKSNMCFLGNWDPYGGANSLKEDAGNKFLIVPNTKVLEIQGSHGSYVGDGIYRFSFSADLRCDLSTLPADSNILTCIGEPKEASTRIRVYRL